MNITPTPVTAALAGVFSAVAWQLLWSRVGGAQSPGTIEVVIMTLLVIVLPAHAFVVGFGPARAGTGRALDTALLKRLGAWIVGALVTVLLAAAITA